MWLTLVNDLEQRLLTAAVFTKCNKKWSFVRQQRWRRGSSGTPITNNNLSHAALNPQQLLWISLANWRGGGCFQPAVLHVWQPFWRIWVNRRVCWLLRGRAVTQGQSVHAVYCRERQSSTSSSSAGPRTSPKVTIKYSPIVCVTTAPFLNARMPQRFSKGWFLQFFYLDRKLLPFCVSETRLLCLVKTTVFLLKHWLPTSVRTSVWRVTPPSRRPNSFSRRHPSLLYKNQNKSSGKNRGTKHELWRFHLPQRSTSAPIKVSLFFTIFDLNTCGHDSPHQASGWWISIIHSDKTVKQCVWF